MRLARFVTTLALGALAATGVALAARAAMPRLQHRRELARAIDEARQAYVRCDEDRARRAYEHLVDFDDAEAVLALVDAFAHPTIHDRVVRDPLERSIELFATTPEPRDPRPAAALAALARSDAEIDRRFAAFAMLEELAQPRFPIEPCGFDDRPVAIQGDYKHLGELVAPIAAASSVPIELGEHADRIVEFVAPVTYGTLCTVGIAITDRPYRALVRLTQSLHLSLVFERGALRVRDELAPRYAWKVIHGGVTETFDVHDQRATGSMVIGRTTRWSGPLAAELARAAGRELVASPPLALTPNGFDFTDPLKALRALAALNGFTVRERDAKTLELVR